MELKKVNLKDIAPYKNNPRKNDEAVDAVMESIELAQWDDNLLLLEIGDLDLGDLSYLWEPQEENEYDFSEFESENERLKGTETVPISIRVPEKYKDDVMEYLSNGESKTAVGLGKGVLRRCGLL